MNNLKKQNLITATNDTELVRLALSGDQNAFADIVGKYQNLLCSLAYSSLGDLRFSEDIAQETFIEAWKKLNTLKEPEKLKAWLCGILRFKLSHFQRKENKQPLKEANMIAEYDMPEAVNKVIDDSAILAQEQALLWKYLTQMDVHYREPLILFYRKHQSIEHVAAELDLSVDTVKQRLSRGRKILKQSMSTFIEDALNKSKPGVGFTTAVITAIYGISPPAKAGVVGTIATKGSFLIKLSTFLTVLASVSGIISSFFGLKASLIQSRTAKERLHSIRLVTIFFLIAIIYIAVMYSLKYLAAQDNENAFSYNLTAQLVVMAFITSYLFLVSQMFNWIKTLRTTERLTNPQSFTREVDQLNHPQRQYISKLSLFGVPLLHFQFGMPENNDKPAYGWIAGGSKAYGLLFAWGGVAIAPISVGIVSVGLISVGAIGIGIIGTGAVGIGLFGFGASAIAYQAYGSISALGWESAFSGGFSIAKQAAIGTVAYASHINSEQAAETINLTLLSIIFPWILAAMSAFVIIPAILHYHQVQRRMQ
ncbi:sigma-70 family RNA polymerase sigma factor [Catenovulum sp. 2E275]|uniref:RNA polymerase sigma factor n=1 Tax=Catenovulum sp. 2E275 TaxID=2980497 RepID=UPI0021CFEFC5|nr:sigma-70 family RNA polymerase sigma factor [Catenovulum sp. 2E275]MCU4675255.1 sigma-70 family RNA polymerase sigma factor [Catenovulum sp. 2E275]